MKSKRVTFTRDEQEMILSILYNLNPDKFSNLEAKSVLYKVKTLNEGDTIVWQRR